MNCPVTTGILNFNALFITPCCTFPTWRPALGAEPRCTGCGHRQPDPLTGTTPRQTRYLGPRAWFAEMPARKRAIEIGRSV